MYFQNILLLLFAAQAFTKEDVLEIPEVDHLISSISNQQWEEDEQSCQIKILDLLENVKNSTLWATYAWNSMPGGHSGIFYGARYQLGSYDQCLKAPWVSTHPELKMKYCLADVEMGTGKRKKWQFPGPYAKAEEYYIDSGTETGRAFSYMAYGICLPASCPSKSAERVVRLILSNSHLRAARNAEVSISHCEEEGTPKEYGRGYYIYLYTLRALCLTAIASTVYLMLYPDVAAQDNFVNHVAKSFCLRRNWATLCKEEKDELTCLHGMRFLSAGFITLLHTTLIKSSTSVVNGLDYEKMSRSDSALPFVHFDLFVDTFFSMAGLLLGSRLSTMNLSTPVNLIKIILKRYIRLLSAFAVTVFYLAYVSGNDANGPMYPKLIKPEQESCQKNWWVSLLMIANYVNSLELCHPATWSIACDFHFYVVTLILLYIYRKNPTAGKWATAAVLVFGFVAPGINVYMRDLYPLLTFNEKLEIDLRSLRGFQYGYIASHIRMGPYALGVIAGYYISLYKPAEYRNYFSKTSSILGILGSFVIIGLVKFCSLLCLKHQVRGFLASIFVTFDRDLYTVGNLGLIVFCTYGDVPLIGPFLSWSAFRPLSRLSYGVYVIHACLLYRSKISLRSHMKSNFADDLVETLGLVAASLVLSLAIWLFIEVPLANITNRYLKLSSKEKVCHTNNGDALETNEDAKKVN